MKASAQVQWPFATEIRVAEFCDFMAKTVRERHEQAVMGRVAEIQSTAHPEIKTIPDQHERYIFGSMGIPFAEFV